jgi:hypothetical protein
MEIRPELLSGNLVSDRNLKIFSCSANPSSLIIRIIFGEEYK